MNITDMYSSAVDAASPYYNEYVNENMAVNAALAQLGGSLIGRSICEIGNNGLSLRKLGNIVVGSAAIAAAYFNQATGGSSQNSTLVGTMAVLNAGNSFRTAGQLLLSEKALKELNKALESVEELQKAS